MTNYKESLDKTNEYGVTEEFRHPLVLVRGLPGATVDEIIVFENGQEGQVFALNNDLVEVIVFSNDPIHPGMKAARTGDHLKVSVHEELRGHAVNPLGQFLSKNSAFNADKAIKRPIDVVPPHIGLRNKITRPLMTGTALVDLLLPLGMGQRQMILGDQKTGKTSFLLSTIESCAKDNLVIYAAIGKPWTAISEIYNMIRQKPAVKENTIIVAASASDVPSMIVLAPLTAMTIAEYFRDQGQDVLVLMDDLSTHASAYREISLLAQRFPGRESYPGDIFHLHAKLLERAGSFHHKEKEQVAITCLPVAETVHNNLTSHIVSNLISITDGHLLFDTSIFNQGRRPAIDTSLSVTRVGRQTQNQLLRELRQEMTTIMSKYTQAQNYTQFGAELSEDMQNVLAVGSKLMSFCSQPPVLTIPTAVQIVFAAGILKGWLNNESNQEVKSWRDCLSKHYNQDKETKDMLDKLATSTDLSSLVKNLNKYREKISSLCQTETH